MDIAEKKGKPLLVMDNINAFWNLINWDIVKERFIKK